MTPVEFEVSEPVQVLVGYFNSSQKGWLQVPDLETAAQADERGGVDTVIENAAAIPQMPERGYSRVPLTTLAGKNWNSSARAAL